MSMLQDILEVMRSGRRFRDAYKIVEDVRKNYPRATNITRKRAKRMLRREDKIVLTERGNNSFDVAIKGDKIVLGANEDFFIYFKNVNLKPNGTMEGRYLGEASDSLIDDYCQDIKFDENQGFTMNGETIRTARMVAVNNKTRAVVVIQK
jgi:hypothetical protein